MTVPLKVQWTAFLWGLVLVVVEVPPTSVGLPCRAVAAATTQRRKRTEKVITCPCRMRLSFLLVRSGSRSRPRSPGAGLGASRLGRLLGPELDEDRPAVGAVLLARAADPGIGLDVVPALALRTVLGLVVDLQGDVVALARVNDEALGRRVDRSDSAPVGAVRGVL